MKNKFKFSRITFLAVVILGICFVLLTSCGAKYGQKTAYLEYSSKNSSGCGGSSNALSKADWMINYIEAEVDSTVNEYLIYINENVSEEEKNNINEAKEQIKLTGKYNDAPCSYVNASGQTVNTRSYLGNLEDLIDNYVTDNHRKAIADTDDVNKINNHYQVCLINSDIEVFKNYVSNIDKADKTSIDQYKNALNGTIGCFDTSSKKVAIEALNKVSEVKDVYLIGALFLIQVDERLAELEPIKFKASTVGEFFANFFDNIFIFPVAWLLYALSSLCGGYYVIGLLITTLIVRTIGWPIYAKTNDMSLKMSMMQPELQKVQEKYAGRNDPDSQRMMQMEQMQLYKKYKVGLGGCFAPLLQFPIFMAIYRAVSRIPYTRAIANSEFTLNWANELKANVFGINLFEDRTGGASGQLIGIIILVLLVVGTQILSQVLTQARQKKAQEKQQEDIPLYKRQSASQTQNSTQSTMKFMLWFMIIMMGSFVWTSKAGLGVYWLIGNLYSMAQMVINNLTSNKRLEKLQNKHGIYTVNTGKNNNKKS